MGTRDGLERDSTIANVLTLARQAPIALFGIGLLDEDSVLATSGYLDRDQVLSLQHAGAIGDVIGRFLSVDGAVVELHKRIKAGGIKYSPAESTLTSAVVEVNSHEGMANNPNIKFRSFVCCGLNHRMLHEWVRVLTLDRETMAKFYEAWAFVNASAEALPQHVSYVRRA